MHRMRAGCPGPRWTCLWYFLWIPKFAVGTAPGSVSRKSPSRWGGLPPTPSTASSTSLAVLQAIWWQCLAWWPSCTLWCWQSQGIVTWLNDAVSPAQIIYNQIKKWLGDYEHQTVKGVEVAVNYMKAQPLHKPGGDKKANRNLIQVRLYFSHDLSWIPAKCTWDMILLWHALWYGRTQLYTNFNQVKKTISTTNNVLVFLNDGT